MDRFTKFKKVFILLVATCNPVFGICRDSVVNVIDQPIPIIRKEASLILISEAQTWLGITELTGNNDQCLLKVANTGFAGCSAVVACVSKGSKVFDQSSVRDRAVTRRSPDNRLLPGSSNSGNSPSCNQIPDYGQRKT